MRITGGTYRGRRLSVPKGDQVRPSTDMVRQALYNILLKYGLPQDAAVLDVFCGTGALGLEALSRGAARAVFIDKSAASLAVCRENIATLGLQEQSALLQRDVCARPGAPPAGFTADLLLADPPYRRAMGFAALASLAANGWLAPSALCVLETEKTAPDATPDGFALLEQRSYGECLLWLLRYDPGMAGPAQNQTG